MAKAKTPRQAHKDAETRLATLRMTAEAKAMEQQIALLESPQPVIVPRSEYPAYDTWGMSPSWERFYPWTQPDDTTEGRYRPYYENSQDVRRLRAEARALVAAFPVAQSCLRKLSDYVMGNGFDFVVKPKWRYKKDPVSIQLADLVQKQVDRFLEYNNFVGNLDRHIHEMSRIDGDAFPVLYPEDGLVRCELVDASFVLEPAEKRPLERYVGTSHLLNGWWHGVHTVWNKQLKRDDVTRPLGFHVVFDNLGDQWDYLPVARVEHIKRNVAPYARVGVSDFTVIQQLLEHEGKVLRNTAIGTAINAAIVGIRQHAEGATQSTVENFVSANSTNSYDKALGNGGTRTTYQQNVAPGTVKDIPAGMEWLSGPLGQLNQPVYIEVHQHLLRIIGSRWSFPEFLIASDASNNNLASALVAEDPFVKYCEREQQYYAGHFEDLLGKAMRILHAMGRLGDRSWSQICQLVEINAEYTSPASRDKYQQAQTNQILSENGIISKRTWAADMGFDYDDEQEAINEGSADNDGDGLEQIQLNGLQVTSASEILHQVTAGETAELVAIGLLQSVGIPPGMARQMVTAAVKQAKLKPPEPPPQFGGNNFGADDRKDTDKDGKPLPPFMQKKKDSKPFESAPIQVRAMDLLLEG